MTIVAQPIQLFRPGTISYGLTMYTLGANSHQIRNDSSAKLLSLTLFAVTIGDGVNVTLEKSTNGGSTWSSSGDSVVSFLPENFQHQLQTQTFDVSSDSAGTVYRLSLSPTGANAPATVTVFLTMVSDI